MIELYTNSTNLVSLLATNRARSTPNASVLQSLLDIGTLTQTDPESLDCSTQSLQVLSAQPTGRAGLSVAGTAAVEHCLQVVQDLREDHSADGVLPLVVRHVLWGALTQVLPEPASARGD